MMQSLAIIACNLVALGALQAEPANQPPEQIPVTEAPGTTMRSVPAASTSVPAAIDPGLSIPAGELITSLGIDPQRIRWHVADPSSALQYVQQRRTDAESQADRLYAERLGERIQSVFRPRKVALTLEDALHRAMTHSLAVRVASYNPAIETTRIVEAEAAFDATFAAGLTKNKQNQPTSSALMGTNVDTLTLTSGIGKLLPTGMQVSTGLNLQRSSNDIQFQEINPVWNSSFVVEFRQPLLRGFGIDYNRSFIALARLDKQISEHTFRRQVIDTLVNVEQAYWNLVLARRQVVISARLLADFEQIYDYLWQRREFDAYRIQISETRARLEKTKAQYVQVLANVRTAEDQLLTAMNDPTLNLAEEVEIVPLDFPSEPLRMLDRLSEVQAALDHRPELYEATLRVKQAKIAVGQAKNQTLPKTDLTFRYTVDGLGESADDAFDDVTRNDFHEYFISIDFELPIGNRARRVALRRAMLQHSQAIASLKQIFENVIFDVNRRLRDVHTSYDQIDPEFQSVEANEDQVEAIRARAESKNFVQLSQELSALQNLASSRQSLLRSMVDYVFALVELERAKGTLPEYNNIMLVPEVD